MGKKGGGGGVLPKGSAKNRRDWEGYFVIEGTDGLIRFAGDIAEEYLLRGFDSFHLASAIHMKNKANSDIHFSSYDTRLNQSAAKQGIAILS